MPTVYIETKAEGQCPSGNSSPGTSSRGFHLKGYFGGATVLTGLEYSILARAFIWPTTASRRRIA
ncbi:MAG: hypothetical protein JWO88_3930 [Frankiales bacterium]|nr:hypothetical protein [Frankiales bacterium]